MAKQAEGRWFTGCDLEGIFAHWLDAVLLVDPEKRTILYANPATSRLLGYSLENLQGRLFSTLVPGQGVHVAESLYEHMHQADAVFEYEEFRRADGTLVPMDVTATLSPWQNKKIVIVNLRDATEREAAEARLRNNELRYRRLIESTTDYVYSVRVERNYPVETTYSRACEGVTGYPFEMFEADPSLWIRIVHEEDRELVRRQTEDILSGRRLYTVEHRIIRQDGEVRWVSNTPVPDYDHRDRLVSYDGLVKDITERVQADAEQKRLAAALEQTDDGVLITDKRGNIVFANGAVQRSSGYSRRELIGQNVSILSSGLHTDTFFRQLWETITLGEGWSGKIACRRKDGRIQEVDNTITPIRNRYGHITHFVAIRRDVTSRLLLREHMRGARQVESLASLTEGVTHDLQQMLTMISAYHHLLEEKNGHNLSRVLKRIGEVTRQASDLLRGVQTFSAHIPKTPHPIYLVECLQKVVRMVHPALPDSVRFLHFISKNCGPVMGSHQQIEQLVFQLCAEALKGMEPDGGELGIRLEEVEVSQHKTFSHGNLAVGHYALITVYNTGSRLSPEVEHAFMQPFPTPFSEHTGLAIARSITSALGGLLVVEDRPAGPGTQALVYLPLTRPASQAVPVVQANHPRGRGESVLWVEDNAVHRSRWKDILLDLGYSVTLCADRQGALRAMQSEPDAFDAAILDDQLGDESGILLGQQLHALRKEVCLILISGYSIVLTEERLREVGFETVLYKPLSPGMLSEALAKALQKKKSNTEE